MAARTRRAGGFTQRQPGRTDWGRFLTSTPIIIAAGAKSLIATFSLINPGISETVRRTRGTFLGHSSVTTAGDVIGALGFIVVSDLAIAAGAASIPGPVTDASDDGWFVWESTMSHQTGSGTSGAENELIHFDSKAMRTVNDGFTIAVMFENGSAADSIDLSLAVSLLGSRR